MNLLTNKTIRIKIQIALLFTTSAFFIFGCSSASMYVRDAVPVDKEKIVISADVKSGNNLFSYGGSGLEKLINDPGFKSFPSPVVNLYRYKDIVAAVTDSDGIFIPGTAERKTLQIPINAQGLPDHRIRDLYFKTEPEGFKIFITYFTPGGVGVTECNINKDFQVACKTYNTFNSELKSNFVHQIVSDIKGNIWFRYSDSAMAGVSRLNPDGKWYHFDRRNSNIGDSSVMLIRAESENEGLKGDNVWFVTAGGLSKLQYGEAKEEWFFYGDKQTVANKFINAIGLQHWFTDAIVDIRDLAVLPDSLIIANKDALFHFTENNIERFVPDVTGGTDALRITEIQCRNNNIFVKIRPHREPVPSIRYFMLFQRDLRKWQKIDYWQFEKEYAKEILLLPYNENEDILIINYPSKKSRIAFFSYKDLSLRTVIIGDEINK
ncbi:MAG: hypothetical protein V1874_02840 [Spirochaetota bacterium]